ncbi:MAG: hypothetical protein M3N13_09030, partial [Candidatus Eremiobacteraeota bacterium]|nr:hypothetical protein [Candidatus Eremiobacteraeota bacterium]
MFLHALARFGEGGLSFIPRERQRAFVGVSATLGQRDLVFVPLIAGGRTLGIVALIVDGEPTEDERGELSAFCSVVTRVLDSDRALSAA